MNLAPIPVEAQIDKMISILPAARETLLSQIKSLADREALATLILYPYQHISDIIAGQNEQQFLDGLFVVFDKYFPYENADARSAARAKAANLFEMASQKFQSGEIIDVNEFVTLTAHVMTDLIVGNPKLMKLVGPYSQIAVDAFNSLIADKIANSSQ